MVKNIDNKAENGLTIKLGIGQYDIEAYLITLMGENYTRMNFTIPEEEIVTDEQWLSEDETVTIPETVFNSSRYNGACSRSQTIAWD